MARIDEIKKWLANQGGGRDEVAGYIHSLELQHEVMRRRNGELMVALREADADAADAMTPYAGMDSRYVMLDRILSIASEVAAGSAGLDDLVDAVRTNESYWSRVAEARREKREKGLMYAARRRAS